MFDVSLITSILLIIQNEKNKKVISNLQKDLNQLQNNKTNNTNLQTNYAQLTQQLNNKNNKKKIVKFLGSVCMNVIDKNAQTLNNIIIEDYLNFPINKFKFYILDF